jgi:copper chaperone CopZ
MNFFNRKPGGKLIELTVNDMRCAHCEAAVKIALKKVPGVKHVKVNRRQKRAVITLDSDEVIPTGVLITAVTTAGYRAELAPS